MKTINWKALTVAAALMVAPGCIMQHGDDSEDDGSSELDPEPTDTSTLRLENKSSYTIVHLYMWRCGEASNTHDQLGGKTIAAGAVLSLTGVPPGCWYMQARSSTSYWQTPQGVTFASGKPFTWQLFNGE